MHSAEAERAELVALKTKHAIKPQQEELRKKGTTGIAASTAKIPVLSIETVIANIHILAVHILKEKD